MAAERFELVGRRPSARAGGVRGALRGARAPLQVWKSRPGGSAVTNRTGGGLTHLVSLPLKLLFGVFDVLACLKRASSGATCEGARRRTTLSEARGDPLPNRCSTWADWLCAIGRRSFQDLLASRLRQEEPASKSVFLTIYSVKQCLIDTI